MAIRPPSDIVLDVARAIDPLRYQQAVGRLARMSGPSGAAGFDQVFNQTGSGLDSLLGKDVTSTLAGGGSLTKFGQRIPDAEQAKLDTFRKFEAASLSTFVQEMLPQNADAVFGEGTAGDVWKSMLAEQIANQMAAGGGIGIAAQLAKSNGDHNAAAVRHSALGPLAPDVALPQLESISTNTSKPMEGV